MAAKERHMRVIVEDLTRVTKTAELRTNDGKLEQLVEIETTDMKGKIETEYEWRAVPST